MFNRFTFIMSTMIVATNAMASINAPQVTNNSSNYEILVSYSGSPTRVQVLIDSDNLSSTGFLKNKMGADYLLENGTLYKFKGTSQSSWSWTSLKSVTFTKPSSTSRKWTLLKSDIASPSTVKMLSGKNSPEEFSAYVSAGSTSPVSTAPAISTPVVTNNTTSYSIQFSYSGSPTLVQLFIDSNNSSASGYSYGGIGAEYLLENGDLYQFSGSSQSTWGWSFVKSVTFTNSSGSANWNISKSDLGNTSQLKLVGARNNPEAVSSAVSIVNSGSSTAGSTTSGSSTGGTSTGGTSTGSSVTVQPNISTATFNNPERGFYVFYDNGVTTSSSSFAAQVAAGKTVADIGVDLSAFKTSALDDAFLTKYQTMFNNARAAGVKLVLIHKYHAQQNFTSDPASSIILNHIAQLTPIISNNADVVLAVHAGFIGAWGEWYYTQHTNSVRKSVVKALLDGIPSSLTVGIRTPAFKINMFNMTGPNQPGVDAAYAKRVGHHNDCFVTGPDDVGTGGGYNLSSPSNWRDFIGLENKALSIPVGGETCWFDPAVGNAYGSCSNAKAEMARQGYSYMHDEGWYGPTVNGWKTGGCYNEMDQKLGYRFKVNQVTVPSSISKSGTMNFNMKIENVGYAGMINNRPVKLVLFNSSAEHIFDLNQLPQKWIPGIHDVTASIDLSQLSIAPGSYNVAIWMPDNATNLRSRAVYSVQFANQGAWDSVKGWNIIKNSSQENLAININN